MKLYKPGECDIRYIEVRGGLENPLSIVESTKIAKSTKYGNYNASAHPLPQTEKWLLMDRLNKNIIFT